MTKRPKTHFTPEFRLGSAQLVVDQGYSVGKSVQPMNIKSVIVHRSTVDKWVRQLPRVLRLWREAEYREGSVFCNGQFADQ